MTGHISRKGFTLVETAVVLVVMGTIAAILVPTLVSIVKRGKVTEARDVLYAVRDEIIGYAEAHNNTIPDALDKLGNPQDPWGRSLRYWRDDDAVASDVCNNFDSTALTYITRDNETVSDIVFVLASDGPDHSEDVTLGNHTDAVDPDDDLLLYVTLYHLQAVLCDPASFNDISGNGTFIDFEDFADYSFIVSDNDEDISGTGVVVNSDNTITLGFPDGSEARGDTYGCIWYAGSLGNCANGDCEFGDGFKAFFTFNASTVGDSNFLADGFTFSVISAASNSLSSCGGYGSTLGYSSTSGAGSNADAGEYPFVNPPKIAVEFDFHTSSQFHDPPFNDDHLGILYWGDDGTSMLPDSWGSWKTDEDYDAYRGGDDNDHDPDIIESGNPLPPDYVPLKDLNDNGSVSYNVRIEISRTDNDDGTGNYTTQVWFDCKDCSDMNASGTNATSFNCTEYSYSSMVLNSTWHSKFDQIMFGWTEGTGNIRQNITIKDGAFYFVGDD